MKILMVCLGNICRSPLAEGVLRQKAAERGLDWTVDSAATESFHVGEPPHRLSQKVARLHGIDISGQRARRFIPADLDKFDRIYAMAPDVYREMERIAGKKAGMEKVDLLMDVLHPGAGMEVPDPWYGGEQGYHEAYGLIEEACEKILDDAEKPGV